MGTNTVTLRWSVATSSKQEWDAMSEKKRKTFKTSQGKKNPPVRGADLPGAYYVDVYTSGAPRKRQWIGIKTTRDTLTNSERERQAIAVANHWQDEAWKVAHDFDKGSKSNVPFIDYYKTLLAQPRHTAWKGALYLLDTFPLNRTPLRAVNYEWLNQFQQHLLKSPTRAKRVLSQNSASTYYAKIKAALEIAVQRDLIPTNPARKIKAIQQVPSMREFLTQDELELLARTPCRDAEVKRAFFFSCFTGLRLSDVRRLRFTQYQNGRLVIRIKKTKQPEYVELHPFAAQLLGEERASLDLPIFDLPSDGVLWNHLQHWQVLSGIAKHVTFHVARHTFATMMLQHTKDIYLVKELLGNTEIRTTQVYAKLLGDYKRDAVHSLPGIRYNLSGDESKAKESQPTKALERREK